MRVLLALGLLAIFVGAGCSLLVSTSGLTDGKTAPDASTPALESGAAPMTDAGVDSGVDSGDDAAVPAELPGLVGAWLFDDGTTKDSSGKGRPGLLSGSATVMTSDRGNVLTVSGGGSMIVNALDGAAFPRSGTISLWFRWSDMDPTEEEAIFDSWNPGRDHVLVRHANNDALGSIQVAFQTKSSADYIYGGGFNTTKDAWTHVVVTWDEANRVATVTVNGKLVDTDGYGAPFAPTDETVFFGRGLHGMIDDIRLYDRALTPAEAAALQ